MLQAETTPEPPTTEQLAHTVLADCQRAIRRLDILIRERDDILLLQARDAVRHAAALSARQLVAPET